MSASRWTSITRILCRLGRFTCKTTAGGALGVYSITHVIYENGVEVFRNGDKRVAQRWAEAKIDAEAATA